MRRGTIFMKIRAELPGKARAQGELVSNQTRHTKKWTVDWSGTETGEQLS